MRAAVQGRCEEIKKQKNCKDPKFKKRPLKHLTNAFFFSEEIFHLALKFSTYDKNKTKIHPKYPSYLSDMISNCIFLSSPKHASS